MTITRKDVDHVAKLARLELTGQEKEQYTVQIENILKFVDVLNAVDTTNVPPTSHAVPLVNAWRPDVCVPTAPKVREQLLNNAPEREDDFFKVKKVIE